jgi:Tyrosine phosphatase family
MACIEHAQVQQLPDCMAYCRRRGAWEAAPQHDLHGSACLVGPCLKSKHVCYSSGKDRTGLMSALLLLMCGVAPDALVRDYVQSEANLKV